MLTVTTDDVFTVERRRSGSRFSLSWIQTWSWAAVTQLVEDSPRKLRMEWAWKPGTVQDDQLPDDQ